MAIVLAEKWFAEFNIKIDTHVANQIDQYMKYRAADPEVQARLKKAYELIGGITR